MKKNRPSKSVFDMGVDVADEIGDTDLMASVRQLRDDHNLQVSRAKSVFDELTSGLPVKPSEDDGLDYLDWLSLRINKVIKDNLDSDSIWEFLLLCGTHKKNLRATASNQIARINIAKEERAKVYAERSEMLSAAGLRGARTRAEKYESLKKWALKEARDMKDDDKGKARKLAAELPKHLSDVSDDPARLIYDAIRAQKKPN